MPTIAYHHWSELGSSDEEIRLYNYMEVYLWVREFFRDKMEALLESLDYQNFMDALDRRSMMRTQEYLKYLIKIQGLLEKWRAIKWDPWYAERKKLFDTALTSKNQQNTRPLEYISKLLEKELA